MKEKKQRNQSRWQSSLGVNEGNKGSARIVKEPHKEMDVNHKKIWKATGGIKGREEMGGVRGPVNHGFIQV